MIQYMTGNFLIRKAIIEDYSNLLPLFEELDSLHRTHLPDQFQKPTGNPRSREFFNELVTDPDSTVLLVEKMNQIMGFVQIMIRETPRVELLVPRVYAVIDSLVISAEQQRQGLGSKLVEAAEVWAQSRGAEYLDLNVYSFNQTAITFYSNLGFSEISRKYRKDLQQN